MYVPRRFADAKLAELPQRYLDRVQAELVPRFAQRWARITDPAQIASDPLWASEIERIGHAVLAEVLAELRAAGVEGSA
jgi:hypothetical protein